MAQNSFLALSVLTFLAFAWAIHRYFIRPSGAGGMPFKMKVLQLLGASAEAIIAIEVLRTEAAPIRILVAISINALSTLLFFWALRSNLQKPLPVAFADLPSQGLVTSGPYRWVRNPFYTSYMLFWMAGLLATLSPWATLPVLGLFYLYWDAARAEELLLSQQFGDEYRQYRDQVGRFFPKLLRANSSKSPQKT